jgi:hypothetical protein
MTIAETQSYTSNRIAGTNPGVFDNTHWVPKGAHQWTAGCASSHYVRLSALCASDELRTRGFSVRCSISSCAQDERVK